MDHYVSLVLFLLSNFESLHNAKGTSNFAFFGKKVFSFAWLSLLHGIMPSKDLMEITKG